MRTYFTLLFWVIISNIYSQNDERRIALVIGNSTYTDENSLKNPVNDANLIASTLSELGFTVIKRTNLDRQQMTNAISEFWAKLSQYNVALFYYAGHGVAVNGVNYLLPVDANMSDVSSVELDAISVTSIVSKFDKFPNNTNILILDACRNNPFKEKRGSDRGFKPISPSKGTLIAFAAADGEFAGDNPSGNNGIFTEKLVSQMQQAIMIEQVFKKTRSLVQIASNNEQNPMEWNMLNNDFYFVKPSNNFGQIEETNKSRINLEEETLTGTLKISSNFNGSFFLDSVSKGEISQGKIYTLRNIPIGEHIIKVGKWSSKVLIETNKVLEVNGIDMKIGSNYEGGIIFYIDESGEHGLICAPIDQVKAQWGCNGTKVIGADGTVIGTGNQNTIDIVNSCIDSKIAAKICKDLLLNGYKDWFLPSKDELGVLYNNLRINGIGNFTDNLYWSSSEISFFYAWVCNFSNGQMDKYGKEGRPCSIRAIRKF